MSALRNSQLFSNSSNENNLIYFLLTTGKEEQMTFISELFIGQVAAASGFLYIT